MSYLDLPRINMLGTFFTDPSTVNNDPSHYDPACTRPSPWQEPKGQHRFQFTNVSVTAALDTTGRAIRENDPLIGAAVSSTDQPSAAKIVDLDVYQQAVTTLYGFVLQVTLPNDAKLTGAMDPCALNSMRFSRVLPTRGWRDWDEYGSSSFGGDSYGVGFFQSVLRVSPDNWPPDSVSGLSAQLRARTSSDSQGNLLISFRFVLDGYQNVPDNQAFRTGRIVGTLGPVNTSREPLFVPGTRWLSARPLDKSKAAWFSPDLYDAPFQIAERGGPTKTIVIDLANALATDSSGGSIVPLGDLAAQFGDGSSGPAGPFPANDSLYTSLGGIVEIPLTAAQCEARNQPVSLVTSRTDIDGPALWTESASGFWFAVQDRSIRLASEAGSAFRSATSRVSVRQWGEPAVGVQLAVEVVPVMSWSPGKGTQGATVPWSAGYLGDTPQALGALEASIGVTDENGTALVTLNAVKDLGSRTPQLDGQLYFVVVYDPRGTPPDLKVAPAAQEHQISCVVWSSYPVNENPGWDEVKAILEPYMKLYPGMRDRIDLTDEQSFFTFALNPPWQPPQGPPVYHPSAPYQLPNGGVIQRGAIPYFMTRPFNDPRYMPPSRDLSPNKVLTILYYVYNLQQNPPRAATT